MPDLIIESLRGTTPESVHRVSAAVVDMAGKLVARSGDPRFPTFLRSAAKPFQAMPAVIDGAARNGIDAMEMAKRLHPSVITLDVQLPVKDGWQVMKELKRHPLCKHIPVVIVSIVDEKHLGFSLGAVDYFVKPVNRDDLIRALDRVHLVRKPGGRPPTVLVLDDDRAATDLIQVILENEGYGVVKAFNGRDGIELAARERPDLIILDLIMPETSGFNVAYQLKQIPATRAIPIIILTSMEIDSTMQEQLESYVSALVSKSAFTKNDLLREIGNIESTRSH